MKQQNGIGESKTGVFFHKQFSWYPEKNNNNFPDLLLNYQANLYQMKAYFQLIFTENKAWFMLNPFKPSVR